MEEHDRILDELLKLPANKECADCGATGPRWASCNLGVFVCINCAGIHRRFGSHISKVKSVSLDKWTPQQIKTMQDIGNAKAKEMYEYNVPESLRRPNEGDTNALEQWIRDKYDRRVYIRRDLPPVKPKVPEKEKTVEAKKERGFSENKTKENKVVKLSISSAPSKAPSLKTSEGPDLLSFEKEPKDDPDQFSNFHSGRLPAFASFDHQSSDISFDSAFFGTSDTSAPKVSKEAILQLYKVPRTFPSSKPMTMNPGTNYNVSLLNYG